MSESCDSCGEDCDFDPIVICEECENEASDLSQRVKESLLTKIDVRDKALAVARDAMSECCIDPCGFDVYKEDMQTLRTCMVEIDRKLRHALAAMNEILGSENGAE